MTIVSTSDEDSNVGGAVAEGTGSKAVVIEGVDSNGDELTETISLDGTTAISLANSYMFINRVYCVLQGTHASGSNVGTITIATTGGATPSAKTYAIIEIGQGQTLQCVFYIPNNYTRFILKMWGGGVGKGDDATILLITKHNALIGTEEAWRTRDKERVYQTAHFLDYKYAPMQIPANSLIKLVATAGTGTIEVTGRLVGHLQL